MKTEIQYRDRLIIYILAAFGLARLIDITILAGFNNYKYCSRKMKYLEGLKLVSSEYLDRQKVFYLTARGYSEIGKGKPTYKLNFSSLHDVEVCRIASYLYLKEGVSYADFLTDRQMKYMLKGSKIHRADLVLGEIAYEFEKTAKANERLKSNLRENKKYLKQIWIVPSDKEFLAERIKRFSKELMLQNVEVIMLGDINEYVLNADISQNKMRDKAVHGERNTELVLKKTNSVVSKYF